MLVTARTEYACLAMIELATRAQESKPVPLTELTEPYKIPPRFLVQILLDLKTAGLVQTTRGSSGGYMLARPAIEITVADIVDALDRLEEPVKRTKKTTTATRELQRIWKGLGDAYSSYLEQFKLSDLVDKKEEADYMI